MTEKLIKLSIVLGIPISIYTVKVNGFSIFLSQAFCSTIQILWSKIQFFQAISKNHHKSAFLNLFRYL